MFKCNSYAYDWLLFAYKEQLAPHLDNGHKAHMSPYARCHANDKGHKA